jgi:hypothetical protein
MSLIRPLPPPPPLTPRELEEIRTRVRDGIFLGGDYASCYEQFLIAHGDRTRLLAKLDALAQEHKDMAIGQAKAEAAHLKKIAHLEKQLERRTDSVKEWTVSSDYWRDRCTELVSALEKATNEATRP